MSPVLLKLAVLLAGFAQLLPGIPPQAGGGAQPGEPPAFKLRVVAFQALDTGTQTVSPELKPFSAILQEFEYDTFRFVNDVEREMDADGRATLPINAIYTFFAQLLGPPADGGNGMRVGSQVQMLDGSRYVDALRTEGIITPGKWLVFRGLPITRGEMVILMTLVQEQDDQQGEGGESDQQDQGESDQNEEEEQQDQQEQGEQDQEQQEQPEEEMDEGEQESQPQPESSQAEEGQELERPEIEALLESLEETDRREQVRSREMRERPFLPRSGEWW